MFLLRSLLQSELLVKIYFDVSTGCLHFEIYQEDAFRSYEKRRRRRRRSFCFFWLERSAALIPRSEPYIVRILETRLNCLCLCGGSVPGCAWEPCGRVGDVAVGWVTLDAGLRRRISTTVHRRRRSVVTAQSNAQVCRRHCKLQSHRLRTLLYSCHHALYS